MKALTQKAREVAKLMYETAKKNDDLDATDIDEYYTMLDDLSDGITDEILRLIEDDEEDS